MYVNRESKRWRAAIHEAGHATMCILNRTRIAYAMARFDGSGVVRHEATYEVPEWEIAIAGCAAESLFGFSFEEWEWGEALDRQRLKQMGFPTLTADGRETYDHMNLRLNVQYRLDPHRGFLEHLAEILACRFDEQVSGDEIKTLWKAHHNGEWVDTRDEMSLYRS